MHIKCVFAIDYQECKEEGCVKDLFLYYLHQKRKLISNGVNNKHGLTLTNSTTKRKAPGKN